METILKLNTPLQAHEIEFRVQSISPKGYATILAYKNARVDMNRLDAVYGVGFWQKKYEVINNNLFCSVAIWNRELSQWVWVSDVGTESNTEKEKGQASDAFKRACFNLGIGRELYDYPFTCIKLNQNEYTVENGRAKQTYELRLKDWTWVNKFDEDGKLSFLRATDEKGSVRFSWGGETNKTTTYNHNTLGTNEKPLISNAQLKTLIAQIKAGDSQAYNRAQEKVSFEASQISTIEQVINSIKKAA